MLKMTPNWTMPKSSTSRMGRMSANSVIVWPRSVFIFLFKFISAPTSEKLRSPRRRGEGSAICPGGQVKNRTTPMSAFAALSERRVKARTEVPLITERVNVVSGFA